MAVIVSERVENLAGKGENAFLPFSARFSKCFFLRVDETLDFVGKGHRHLKTVSLGKELTLKPNDNFLDWSKLKAFADE